MAGENFPRQGHTMASQLHAFYHKDVFFDRFPLVVFSLLDDRYLQQDNKMDLFYGCFGALRHRIIARHGHDRAVRHWDKSRDILPRCPIGKTG